MEIPDRVKTIVWQGTTYHAHPCEKGNSCIGCIFNDPTHVLLMGKGCPAALCTGLLPRSDKPYSIIFKLGEPDGNT